MSAANNRLFSRNSRLLRIATPVRYALEGMRALASDHGRGPVRAERVARRSGVPGEFLAKIFTRLAAKGVLDSRRGPGGGFRLAREPGAIRVADVFESLEPRACGRHRCVLGQRFCGEGGGCPIHETVVEMEHMLLSRFEAMSLAELIGLTL